jgi:hypothetical protein
MRTQVGRNGVGRLTMAAMVVFAAMGSFVATDAAFADGKPRIVVAPGPPQPVMIPPPEFIPTPPAPLPGLPPSRIEPLPPLVIYATPLTPVPLPPRGGNSAHK